MNPTLQMLMKNCKKKKKVVLESCPHDTELERENKIKQNKNQKTKSILNHISRQNVSCNIGKVQAQFG